MEKNRFPVFFVAKKNGFLSTHIFFSVRGFWGNNMGNGAGRFALSALGRAKNHYRIWGIFMEARETRVCGVFFKKRTFFGVWECVGI